MLDLGNVREPLDPHSAVEARRRGRAFARRRDPLLCQPLGNVAKLSLLLGTPLFGREGAMQFKSVGNPSPPAGLVALKTGSSEASLTDLLIF
eukprot:4339252-Pyramimonas_sp.AAC.1